MMQTSLSTVPQAATAFLRRVSYRKNGLGGAPNSISEYIERRALRLTDDELDNAQSTIPALREQLPGITNASEQFPNFRGQVELLANLLEDAAAGAFGPICDALRREASFALFYVGNEADIIPDSIPEIGYADDSLIVRTVLSRHLDVLVEYCEKRPNPANRLVLDA
jgi:uncharacterized membrane protein YkvA (DUF1232 family)